METKVYNKSIKFFKNPTRYKPNAITGDLHRAKKIAEDFNFEVKRITKKLLSPGFPRNFIRNTIELFNKDKKYFIITEWLIVKRKLVILGLAFPESNEKLPKPLSKSLLHLQVTISSIQKWCNIIIDFFLVFSILLIVFIYFYL